MLLKYFLCPVTIPLTVTNKVKISSPLPEAVLHLPVLVQFRLTLPCFECPFLALRNCKLLFSCHALTILAPNPKIYPCIQLPPSLVSTSEISAGIYEQAFKAWKK